ncbi:7027_t:CDS:2, partial [Acaulospora morrowiae]
MSPQLIPKRSFGRLNKANQREDEGDHIDSKKLFCSAGNPITFYIKHAVPERAMLIKLIEVSSNTFLPVFIALSSHGGKVVTNFKEAEFVLADPNKTQRFVSGIRHIYSYKLVMDSIKANQFQKAAEYKLLITGQRNGRRSYTQQDDRFLEDFLRGKSDGLKGNRIYKELEQMNDSHTWQSWRNRAELVVMPNMEIQRNRKNQSEVEPSTNTSNVSEFTESPFFTDIDDQATEQVLNKFLENAKENEIVIDLSEEEDNCIPEVVNETNRQKATEDGNNVVNTNAGLQTTSAQEKLSTPQIPKGDVTKTPVKSSSMITPRKGMKYEDALGSYGSSLSTLGKRSQVVDEDELYDSSENPRHKPFTSRSSQDLSLPIENDIILLDSPKATWPESPNGRTNEVQERIEEAEVETPCPVSLVRLGKRRQTPSDVDTPTKSQSKRLRLSLSPIRQVSSPFRASSFPIKSTNVCNDGDEKEFLTKVKEISEITHRPLTAVIQALGETTCNFEVTKDFLLNGKTLNNAKYIWTSEEDAILTSSTSDKNKVREIVDKHGTN